MNTSVISYSLTGNNEALAMSLSEALGAQHIRIKEDKNRTIGNIAFDMLLNRRPKVSYEPETPQPDDLVIFVAPIWMGCLASPLRDSFKRLRKDIGTYAFVSISGGADENPNPKLADELTKRLHKEPAAVIDMHIADLLPPQPRPTRDDTSAYKITKKDTAELTEKIIAALRERINIVTELKFGLEMN